MNCLRGSKNLIKTPILGRRNEVFIMIELTYKDKINIYIKRKNVSKKTVLEGIKYII